MSQLPQQLIRNGLCLINHSTKTETMPEAFINCTFYDTTFQIREHKPMYNTISSYIYSREHVINAKSTTSETNVLVMRKISSFSLFHIPQKVYKEREEKATKTYTGTHKTIHKNWACNHLLVMLGLSTHLPTCTLVNIKPIFASSF